MKHSKTKKLFAAALAATMVTATMPTTAFAASSRVSQSSWSGFSFSWDSLWDRLFGRGNANQGSSTVTPEEPKEPETSSPELTLLEDESTVENGEMLRASTYALADAGVSATAASPTLKYFPITLYDYDKTTINNATHQVEVDNGLGNTWNGIYFNDGNPSAESYTYRTGEESYTAVTGNSRPRYYSLASSDVEYGSTSYYYKVGNNYYPVYVTRSTSGRIVTSTTYTLYYKNGDTYTPFAQNTNGSSRVDNLYQATGGTTTTTASLPYAAWNYWNKKTNNNDYGQYTYSGLVESTLTATKDITFTKPDGGIFNNDATVKDIYTGVEMPFAYEDGTYTFDSSQNGAYFYANSTQGSTVAQSNGRLYFNEGNPQSNGGNYGDGSTTVWMPFNSTQNIGSEANCDYHFGMRTTIPFTMTANGRMNPNDNNSEKITYHFSGDDDVWVFIDGQLVLDIGGIHNRLDADIDFAENTWSISESNTSTVAVADYNRAAISGTLFNDGDTTGTLNQTRETFAATDSHELTIFYLERGAGSSNCKIKFNLPMKDTVSVQKLVNEKDSEGILLDADTLSQINNRDFGFTLYKNNTPVANANYSLLNENGQYLQTASTDAKGHFTLKNKQTAKFVGEIASTPGDSYYVVEDKDGTGWEVPTFTYTATAAGGATSADSNTNGQSMTVTATGSAESEDSVSFVCTNTMTHVDGTTLEANDDRIVIDYGLPVIIDVLNNDIATKATKSIEGDVTGAQYGTAVIENNKIKYHLTRPLTGVEVLTYTVKATATSGVESDNKTATANVYIIPATSMYYEEDFSGLVMYSDDWSNVGTAQTDPQEPGVVGTVGDSPYGSDAAYLNDSVDSNGSSKYVNTTDAAAAFKYTFTGTGTSFFARTTNNSGYIRVVIKDSTDKQVYTSMRDTSYKTEEGKTATLYNIPVFTYEAENYGTYTVTVTIAGGANAQNYGKKFWLDGIRVVNPLNSSDVNASIANAAYAADGEANMTVATLRMKILTDITFEDENGELTWSVSDQESGNFVLFTDTNGEIRTAEEYKSNGPKEEVYLNKGQSVTFSLKNWDPNTNKIYLGIKAPFGSGSVSISGHSLTIGNASDCYYDISDYKTITEEDGVKTATFEIKATSSLISVTNIKVTGNAEFTIVNQDDENVDDPENDVNVD